MLGVEALWDKHGPFEGLSERYRAFKIGGHDSNILHTTKPETLNPSMNPKQAWGSGLWGVSGEAAIEDSGSRSFRV